MKVLTPLIYCAMKFVDAQSVVTDCGFFAAERIREMPFCEKCVLRFNEAIDDEGVEFIEDGLMVQAQMKLKEVKRGS